MVANCPFHTAPARAGRAGHVQQWYFSHACEL